MKWFKYLFAFLVASLAIAACFPTPRVAANHPDAEKQVATTEVDPAVYRGAAMAQQVCVRCHDVGQGVAPEMNIGAPAFRDVARKADMKAGTLAAWMRSSHPQMPNYIFSESDVGDLAAYVLSLREIER